MIQPEIFNTSFHDEEVSKKLRDTSGMDSSMGGSSNKSLMWKMIVPITEQRNQIFQRRVQTEIATSFDKILPKKDTTQTFDTNEDQETLETTNLSFLQTSKDLDIAADTLQSVQPMFFNEYKKYEEKLHLLQDIYNRKYQKENKDPRRLLTTESINYDNFDKNRSSLDLDSSIGQIKLEPDSRPGSQVRQQRSFHQKDSAQVIFRDLQRKMREYASGPKRNKTADSYRSTSTSFMQQSHNNKLTEISFDFKKKVRDSTRTEQNDDETQETFNFAKNGKPKYNHGILPEFSPKTIFKFRPSTYPSKMA